MRNDLHPLLIAPPIGGEVRVRIDAGLAGERTVRATVVLGIGRPVSLPSGERIAVCAAEHLIHVRCAELAGDRPFPVRAGDCDLVPAPPAADALLGL